MNEEIKEILEYFENNVASNSIYMLKLDTNEANLLLDYITNLQKENKELKEQKKKAIEYINNNIVISFDKVGFNTNKVAGIVVDDLLKILGGDE